MAGEFSGFEAQLDQVPAGVSPPVLRASRGEVPQANLAGAAAPEGVGRAGRGGSVVLLAASDVGLHAGHRVLLHL